MIMVSSAGYYKPQRKSNEIVLVSLHYVVAKLEPHGPEVCRQYLSPTQPAPPVPFELQSYVSGCIFRWRNAMVTDLLAKGP